MVLVSTSTIEIDSLPETPSEEKEFQEAREYLGKEFEIHISLIIKYLIDGMDGFLSDNDYEYVENFIRNYLALPLEQQKKIFVDSEGNPAHVWDDVQTGLEEDYLAFIARLFIRKAKIVVDKSWFGKEIECQVALDFEETDNIMSLNLLFITTGKILPVDVPPWEDNDGTEESRVFTA